MLSVPLSGKEQYSRQEIMLKFKAQKIRPKSKIKGEFSLSFKDWAEIQNCSSLKEAPFLFEVNMHQHLLGSKSFIGLELFVYLTHLRIGKVFCFGKKEFFIIIVSYIKMRTLDNICLKGLMLSESTW